jgi:hypothetical protein
VSDILSREVVFETLKELTLPHEHPTALPETRRLLYHDAAQRARIEELEQLLRRIVDTWPRAEQSMGPAYYFCPACGMRCPNGEKCFVSALRRLGVLHGR